MNNIKDLLQKLAEQKGAKFISLTYKAAESGELARHTLLLGVRLERAYQRDLAILKAKARQMDGVQLEAAQDIIKSMEESLNKGIGNNSKYTQKDVTVQIMPGIKLNINNNELYISAFSKGKTIIERGEYNHVNSSQKTLAKEAIKKELRMGKFRTFKLKNIEKAAINGNVLELA